jgi:hypothetical protein
MDHLIYFLRLHLYVFPNLLARKDHLIQHFRT